MRKYKIFFLAAEGSRVVEAESQQDALLKHIRWAQREDFEQIDYASLPFAEFLIFEVNDSHVNFNPTLWRFS